MLYNNHEVGVKFMKYPKDCSARKIGDKARKIVHYKVDTDHFIYRESTGLDVGTDCILELSENDEWHNEKIYCQVKGTLSPNFLATNEELISFPLDVKTINYALDSPFSFVLFLVDVTKEIVYYECIQEYYYQHKKRIDSLDDDQEKINIHVHSKNIFDPTNQDIRIFAKKEWKCKKRNENR